MDLTIEVHRQNGFAVVSLRGEVDAFTAPKLRDRLHVLVETGARKIVVDMDGLEFCDSTGLGVLISALKMVKTHQGSLSIVCTREKIVKIFRITGLSEVFSIEDSVPSAIASERERSVLPREVSGR